MLFVKRRIAFRFEEIREVVHIMNKDSGANVRKPFQLSLNYRSHSGIVTLGKALVGLLRKHFGVDFMAKAEEAVLQGAMHVSVYDKKKSSLNSTLGTCEHDKIEVILLNVMYSQQGLNLPSFG